MKKCLDCVFFKEKPGDSKQGECKRYPPTLVAELGFTEDEYYSYLNSDLPDTPADSFCGEWRKVF